MRYISHELRTPLNSAFLGKTLKNDSIDLLLQESYFLTISHWIRSQNGSSCSLLHLCFKLSLVTPALYPGLKLITDSLQNCNSPDDLDRREILADVNVACRTTVDILNDLLCFDKLESGILVAHKHEVPVLSFVTDCVGMFSAQARESGVTIAVVNGSDRNSADNSPVSSERSPCINLLESDTINIDKFKMDQVLRNLISNALKFTPRGGVVTISATFAPGGSDKQRHRSGESSVRSPRDFPIVKLQDSFLKKFSFSARKNTTRIYVGPDLEAGDNVKESVASVHTCQPSVSGHLVIVVRDTGVGMVEEDYTRLFKEIVQFNPEVLQAGGGSGLGLWITKGIVDLHDGNVRVHSDGPGFGTSFTIELPMSRSRIMRSTLSSQLQSPKYSYSAFDDDRDDLSRTNSQELDILTRKLSRRHPVFHLLIVDDSPLNRKMLLKIFRAAGHTCDEAEDGEQAVAKVIEKMALEGEDRVYSAILMDFVMPNMDGPTAVKKIRALGYTARIFGVTGNALDSDVSYFLKSGADVVLAKPLEMSIFIHAMRDSPLSHAPYINQETI